MSVPMSMVMRNGANRILIALLSASLFNGPEWAQDQQSARQSQSADSKQAGPIRATSDVVRIDVEVTDKSGKPIKELKAEQFTITDDGKPQKVSSFSYSDIERVETAGAVDRAPVVVPVDALATSAGPAEAISEQTRDRRMMVLFFD